MTPAELSVRFFLQMAVIIGVSRMVGWLAKRFLGQPQVVGEMIAGVLLGPSLFGLITPDLQAALFPKDSRSVLFVGAQLALGSTCSSWAWTFGAISSAARPAAPWRYPSRAWRRRSPWRR